jgi:hypothetical protein
VFLVDTSRYLKRRLQLLHEGWQIAMVLFLGTIAFNATERFATSLFVCPLELLFAA